MVFLNFLQLTVKTESLIVFNADDKYFGTALKAIFFTFSIFQMHFLQKCPFLSVEVKMILASYKTVCTTDLEVPSQIEGCLFKLNLLSVQLIFLQSGVKPDFLTFFTFICIHFPHSFLTEAIH